MHTQHYVSVTKYMHVCTLAHVCMVGGLSVGMWMHSGMCALTNNLDQANSIICEHGNKPSGSKKGREFLD